MKNGKSRTSKWSPTERFYSDCTVVLNSMKCVVIFFFFWFLEGLGRLQLSPNRFRVFVFKSIKEDFKSASILIYRIPIYYAVRRNFIETSLEQDVYPLYHPCCLTKSVDHFRNKKGFKGCIKTKKIKKTKTEVNHTMIQIQKNILIVIVEIILLSKMW